MEIEIVSIREFGRRVGVSDAAIRKAIGNGRISPKCIRTNEKNGRPEMFYEMALKDWQQAGGGLVKEIDQSAGKKKPDAPPPPADPNAPVGAMTMQEANRRKAVYEQQMKALDLAERQKILVNRDLVFEELFNFGVEIKSAIEAMPDKYLDLILAAPSRAEAAAIWIKANNETLEILSRQSQIKI